MQHIEANSTGQTLIETETLESRHGVTLQLTWRLRVFQARKGTHYVRNLSGIKVISLEFATNWTPKGH